MPSDADLARAVVEESLDAILIADDDRRYVEANRSASALLGYSRSELLGMSVDDVVAPDTAATWEQLRADGSLVGYANLRRKDGAVVVAEFRARANVIPGRHLSVLRDATERLGAERRFLEARELAEKAFEFAPVAMAVVEAKPEVRGIIRRVNAALVELLGQAPQELAGVRLLDLVHSHDLETAAAVRAAPPGTAVRVPLALRRGDGSTVWTELTSALVHGASNHDDYVLMVIQDISARRLAEERLRDSEGRFRTMVESSTEGVCTLDADDRVTFLNPRMAEMLAVGVEDLKGIPAAQLFSPQDETAVEVGLAGCRDGVRDRHELQLANRETGALPVIMSAAALTDTDGGFSGTLMMVTDISALVAAEQQRVLERTQLHDLQRSKASLAWRAGSATTSTI